MKKIYSGLLIMTLGLLPLISVNGQNNRGAGVRLDTSAKTKRIALVIGNGNYQHTTKLDNPVNDATDMTSTLKSLGFEVISGTNQNRRQMQNLIRKFGDRLANTKGVGLFFYAGHGVSAGGVNYLIPVDADIQEEDEIDDFSVSMGFLLGKMASANNGFNMVILDACRNNPFARGWRNYRDIGDKGGLARVNAPTGTLIAYATKPGDVASDGDGRNGLYTGALLKQMRVKNVDVTKMLQNVRRDVLQKSNNKQVPFDESSLVGDFYFAGKSNVTSSKQTDLPSENDVRVKNRAQVEREAWLMIQNSSNPEDFRFFLKEFPDGAFLSKANIKLEQMTWNLVKNSKDKTKIQGYLSEFPKGTNASLARIKLRQLNVIRVTTTSNTKYRFKAGTVRKNSIGMDLVYIPSGSFMMGSSSSDVEKAFSLAKLYDDKATREGVNNETPQRRVTIKEGLWMGKFEVTQAQWRSVMGRVPTSCYGEYNLSGDNKPVICISWEDTKEYIRKLNSRNDGFTYSLPTEAEWEYAARAGTTTNYYWGDDSNNTSICGYGNFGDRTTKAKLKFSWLGNPKCKDGHSETAPVGSYKPNNFGLYDMSGNVWEWTEDIYSKDYSGLPLNGSANRSVGNLDQQVLRGGSWDFNGSFFMRSAYRNRSSPSYRAKNIGFRVAARPQ